MLRDKQARQQLSVQAGLWRLRNLMDGFEFPVVASARGTVPCCAARAHPAVRTGATDLTRGRCAGWRPLDDTVAVQVAVALELADHFEDAPGVRTVRRLDVALAVWASIRLRHGGATAPVSHTPRRRLGGLERGSRSSCGWRTAG